MTPDPVGTPEPEPEPGVVDWRPDTAAAVAWNIAGLVITVAALILFALPVMLRSGTMSGTFEVGLLDILLVVVLTVALMAVHEGIHGLVMLGFGMRPMFGAMLIAHVLPALYTTAAGHRFARRQYLVIAAAPALLISVIGFLACFGPWAGYLIVPLAIHLGGCVGDAAAVLRTLREPSSTTCEDLRDGIRFHRLGTAAPG
jgi:hypothetical protein